jgi:hypothetical protein
MKPQEPKKRKGKKERKAPQINKKEKQTNRQYNYGKNDQKRMIAQVTV